MKPYDANDISMMVDLALFNRRSSNPRDNHTLTIKGNLRVQALRHFSSVDRRGGDELAQLFGFRGYAVLCDAMDNDADLVRRVGLLAGPNGDIIYKAMKAKLDG